MQHGATTTICRPPRPPAMVDNRQKPTQPDNLPARAPSKTDRNRRKPTRGRARAVLTTSAEPVILIAHMPESTLTSAAAPAAFLVPLAGPHLAPVELTARTSGLTIGRHEQCDICLPADAEKVSRMHARFVFDGARWHVADLGSRWGTFVNGIKLTPNTDVPLNDGDLIRITPWTFTLSPTAKRRGLQSDDDTGHTLVRAVNPDNVRPLADEI